jgi:pantoate--beta-alanine ligase
MNATGKIVEARKLIDAARADGKRVGFVPTMGALHEGHIALVRRARDENDFVVVSIFVNPAQFGPNEDLSSYPRTFADDLDACLEAGVDLVFHPDADEMYPSGMSTSVRVGGMSEPLEGAHRPGHFDGVALVCSKLFNLVGTCRAYFGEKDAQQIRVIERMVADLDIPVEVVRCPTIRDVDGLAMSSRNRYLSTDERRRALSLSGALSSVEAGIANGERSVSVLLDEARRLLDADAVDYFEIVDPTTLARVEVIDGPVLVCGAIRIGGTRLIDNITVGGKQG